MSFPANRRYSASTLRLYADREASMKRNLLTEVGTLWERDGGG